MTRKVRRPAKSLTRGVLQSYKQASTKFQTNWFFVAATVSSARSTFDSRATMVRWILTSGVRLFLQFWHSKTPVFTFPRGWVPWYVEWTLAFPRAPSGSVSINVWSAACAAVLKVLGDLVESLLVMIQGQTGVKRKEEAMKFGADGKMGTSASAARGSKKEL
jgi:tail-anchored protein insertion receptor